MRGVSPGALVLRLVVFAGPVLALLATGLGGPSPRLLLVVLVAVTALGFAVSPESPLGAVTLGLVVFWWGLAAGADVPLVALPAAWLMLAAHVSAVLLAHGPKELPVDGALLRRWLLRAGLLGVLAPALWLLADAVADQPEPTGIWVAGLSAAILVCIAAAGALSFREPAA